ncbi:MAG: hypothetical protein IJL87_00275 [Clostridia bacterium]|nr:hypothetical protein [Clostridia bacterium]
MANAADKAQCFFQNLADAGCDEDMIAECVKLYGAGNKKLLADLLRKKRRELLESIHSQQKKLDCLDYLIYQTEK